MAKGKALFLDRDGTINVDPDFLLTAEQIELIPGSAEAMARARRAGYKLVCVTNQSAVARGLLTEETLAAIHQALQERLAACGAALDAIYYCPHLEGALIAAYDRTCDCRKPKPGLVLRAADELGVEPSRSWTIGDRRRDIEAGRAAGTRTAFVATGPEPDRPVEADVTAANLAEAIDRILALESRGSEPENQ